MAAGLVIGRRVWLAILLQIAMENRKLEDATERVGSQLFNVISGLLIQRIYKNDQRFFFY